MTVLYITQNGIADHIGQSQVVPYVLGLARLGHKIHLLSAEKDDRREIVDKYARIFADAGIRWTHVPYRNSPRVIGPALTQWRLSRAADWIVRTEGVHAVHCRSFPAAMIGRQLKRRHKIRYLFDFRDFYADGGLAKGSILLRPVYSWIKRLEGPMIREADRVVCLTERARDILLDWYRRDEPGARERFSIIPCCADFAHFDSARIDPDEQARVREALGLVAGQPVLLYLGSLGPDYLLPDMMALFAELMSLRPDAKFVFLSNNGRGLVEAECERRGIAPDRIVFTTAERDRVPLIISLATLSVIFIRADLSKAGCSPTKLAELFAMGVPVVANSGVGDMDRIISPEVNGSVLVKDFLPETLRNAIARLLELRGTATVAIRQNSRAFDLPVGVVAYDLVYRELEVS